MKKKMKKIVHYRHGEQKFDTFRELKWHMYLNMQKNTIENAYQYYQTKQTIKWERRKWNDDIYVYDPDLNAFDETKTQPRSHYFLNG